MIRWLNALMLGLVFSTLAQAQQRAVPPQPQAPQSVAHPYYGRDFFGRVQRFESGDSLKQTLLMILKSNHRAKAGDFDDIVPNCQGQQGCYSHTVLGYNSARVFLMGSFYLVQNGRGYGVRDVYCERVYAGSEFRGNGPGPNQIPDARVVNTEHTWPQSRFTGRYPNEQQKSDLHHLFPTDSQMNSIRSSFQFGDVVKELGARRTCNNSSFGRSASGRGPVFEPPDSHKGNVARALFYFAVRYEMRIDPEEESTLRRWNQEDPVDAEEMKRNDGIYQIQRNRNPFIDYPWLADRVTDF